ncbi:hypothetical protein AAON49_04015 [Pseudotenacibaculum sp. MALMAid0570]|uniref:hypothetical protein n=1 Tax=Pseudotenacibaculum sp. MALMAid0570 TaxID=3143938 RepID=UPI0032DFE39B
MNFKLNIKLSFIILIVVLFFSCTRNEKFDSKKWKESTKIFLSDERLKMVNDLISSRLLLGKSENEIIQQIGENSNYRLGIPEANPIKYFSVYDRYEWDIDPVELIFLKIEFDNKGKSSKVELFSKK